MKNEYCEQWVNIIEHLIVNDIQNKKEGNKKIINTKQFKEKRNEKQKVEKTRIGEINTEKEKNATTLAT